MLDAGYWILDARCSMLDWIEELGSVIDARMKLHESLAPHTSFRIGGPADVFAEIGNMEQLRNLVSFCRSAEASPIPLLIIGRGMNLLVSDKGVRGVVARLCGDLAQVSSQHANFIVNTGGATATDVLSLIDRVRSTIRERTGIDLELELKVVGYNG